jgi:thiamine biosynthesis lipoprotein
LVTNIRKYKKVFKAMGCPCRIILNLPHGSDDHQLFSLLQKEIQRLEYKYSFYLKDSVVAKVNNNSGINKTKIDSETASLFEYANTCYEESNGLFDITVAPLRKLWNYQLLEKEQVLPRQNQIDNKLKKVGWNKVGITANDIYLPFKGMQIDLGGIVKEYAADSLSNIAINNEVISGLIELGGDIRIFNTSNSNESWPIGIVDPSDKRNSLATINLISGALATSGDYERFSVINNKKYSHIINPLTGWPIDSFSSISVVSEQCIVAGALSTIAILKENRGESWLIDQYVPYLCITNNGKISGTIVSD